MVIVPVDPLVLLINVMLKCATYPFGTVNRVVFVEADRDLPIEWSIIYL
jgi:hypothetical protein